MGAGLAAYYRNHEQRKAENAAWNKAHRETTRLHTAAWRAKNPEKTRAHGIVRRAIAKGKIVRGACTVCGQTNAEAHHEDYNKPLEITWLCRVHHREHHRKAMVA